MNGEFYAIITKENSFFTLMSFCKIRHYILSCLKFSDKRMIDLFHLGLTDLHDIWVRILSEEVLDQLSRLQEVPARDFRIPDSLWAHIIYDAAVAHHRNVLPQEHLLKALTPLYLGKTASFVLDSQGLTTAEAEHLIETLCRTFEKEKEYLVTRWPQSHDARDVVSTTPVRSERSQP